MSTTITSNNNTLIIPTSGGHIIPYHTANTQSMQACAQHLAQGGLVAFPTETVYGLGANALQEDAVLNIFKAKQRPLTDPVIVHVLNVEQALPLVDLQQEQIRKVYIFLANTFWPGPLTLVAQANLQQIPNVITASTGYVGIRSPKHPVARELIEKSQLPIAAPSANRFGHVSPTTADHVMEDLGASPYPILILDVGKEGCHVGIESTVAKVEQVENVVHVTVLRKGGISFSQIEAALQELQQQDASLQISVSATMKKVANNTTVGQKAPGQMITHYAPDVSTYLHDVSQERLLSITDTPIPLSDVVVIDFAQQLLHTKPFALAYRDMSAQGSIQEATKVLFDCLRYAEKVPQAKAVLLVNMQPQMTQKVEHADAIFDRMFRAASGRLATLTSTHLLVQQQQTEKKE